MRVARGTPLVLVAGAFGQQNPGDESVLDAFIQGLGGCEVVATTSDAAGTARDHGCRPVDAADRWAVGRVALQAALVVVTATVFKTLHPASGRRRHALLANTLAMALAARGTGRPLAVAGAGAACLEGPAARVLARAIVRAAGPVVLRDEESAAILRHAGIRGPLAVGADVTWALLPGGPAESGPPLQPAGPAPGASAVPPFGGGAEGCGSRDTTVVVAVSHLAGGDQLADGMAAGLRALSKGGARIVLQPWQPLLDKQAAAALSQRLEGVPLEWWDAPSTVPSAAAMFATGGARLVVAQRFHSIVAGAAAGVPVVAIAHEPKLAGLARRLGQPAVLPSASGVQLEKVLSEAVHSPPPAAALVEGERAAALRSLASLQQLAFERAR